MDSLISRSHYAALEHCTYLNQASLGLIPRQSTDAMTTFLCDVAQHGNVRLSDADETGVLNELRAAGGRVLGAPIDSIAVVSGASEGLNQATSMLATAGGQVVLVSTDFPCVTSPWLNAEQRIGMSIRWVDDQPDTDLTAELIAGIEDATTVVCFSAVQYASGTLVDVSAVTRRAHDVGATVVVDVTQMAGAAPVMINDWQADVVVCSGYKWLSGHGGVALLAVSDRLVAETPHILGWMGTVDPFDFDAQHLRLAEDARRYQLSTMAYSSAVGLTASLGLLEQTGFEAIGEHTAEVLGGL
jgi:cysteine desulfurase/selenocysteine lyase